MSNNININILIFHTKSSNFVSSINLAFLPQLVRLTGNRGTSKSDGMDRGQHPFVDYAERENKDAGADERRDAETEEMMEKFVWCVPTMDNEAWGFNFISSSDTELMRWVVGDIRSQDVTRCIVSAGVGRWTGGGDWCRLCGEYDLEVVGSEVNLLV